MTTAFNFARYTDASALRLTEARRIADALRHDGSLHRLAMTAVFVLEDCHEAFRRMQDEADARRGLRQATRTGSGA